MTDQLPTTDSPRLLLEQRDESKNDWVLQPAEHVHTYGGLRGLALRMSYETGRVHRIVNSSLTPVYQTPEPDPRNYLKVGQRVRFDACVERYPQAYVRVGETGTVMEVGDFESPVWFSIKLDSYYPGLDEWENCVHFYPEDQEWPEVTVIGNQDGNVQRHVDSTVKAVAEEVAKATDDLRSDLYEALNSLEAIMAQFGGEPASDDKHITAEWETAHNVLMKHNAKQPEPTIEALAKRYSALMLDKATPAQRAELATYMPSDVFGLSDNEDLMLEAVRTLGGHERFEKALGHDDCMILAFQEATENDYWRSDYAMGLIAEAMDAPAATMNDCLSAMNHIQCMFPDLLTEQGRAAKK